MLEDVVEGLLGRYLTFAGDFCEVAQNKAEVFGEEVAAELHLKAFDDALQVVLGVGEGLILTGGGDDDVVVVGMGSGVDELLAQAIESHAVFGLKGIGLVLDADDGLVVAHGDVGVGHAGLRHQDDDAGTLGGSQ